MAAMPVHFSLCILADVVANDYDMLIVKRY